MQADQGGLSAEEIHRELLIDQRVIDIIKYMECTELSENFMPKSQREKERRTL